MPTKQPRGEELTREQQRTNQVLHARRLRIEHVNSSVKRCRIVKDRIRLWKEGVRDVVMELCCALHNFRVRLTPWCVFRAKVATRSTQNLPPIPRKTCH